MIRFPVFTPNRLQPVVMSTECSLSVPFRIVPDPDIPIHGRTFADRPQDGQQMLPRDIGRRVRLLADVEQDLGFRLLQTQPSGNLLESLDSVRHFLPAIGCVARGRFRRVWRVFLGEGRPAPRGTEDGGLPDKGRAGHDTAPTSITSACSSTVHCSRTMNLQSAHPKFVRRQWSFNCIPLWS